MKDSIIKYIEDTYDVLPEYPWAKYDSNAAFRHRENRKWFALIMDVRREKLSPELARDAGMDVFAAPDDYMPRSGRGTKRGSAAAVFAAPDAYVPVINLKIDDPAFRDMLVGEDGIFPAYHMNKEHWITVLLDGTVPFDEVIRLLEASYQATSYLKAKHKDRAPKEWIIPSNPRYYDIEHAFDEAEEIEWKQGRGINVGDIVYLYVGAPVSAVRYCCRVTKTDIPYDFDNGKLKITSLMLIKLLRRYDPEEFPFERLRDEYGIYAIRGPRGIPNSLSSALRSRE